MRTPEDRFWAKVRVHTRDCPQHPGCWEWIGARSRGGDRRYQPTSGLRAVYGTFWFRGRTVRAHRWSYRRWRGRLSRAWDLDHIVCDWSLCVHPFHVSPTLPTINRGRRRRSSNAFADCA